MEKLSVKNNNPTVRRIKDAILAVEFVWVLLNIVEIALLIKDRKNNRDV